MSKIKICRGTESEKWRNAQRTRKANQRARRRKPDSANICAASAKCAAFRWMKFALPRESARGFWKRWKMSSGSNCPAAFSTAGLCARWPNISDWTRKSLLAEYMLATGDRATNSLPSSARRQMPEPTGPVVACFLALIVIAGLVFGGIYGWRRYAAHRGRLIPWFPLNRAATILAHDGEVARLGGPFAQDWIESFHGGCHYSENSELREIFRNGQSSHRTKAGGLYGNGYP